MTEPDNSETDLALQLFTVHNELNEDPSNTLDWVKETGFKSIELAGFGSLSAEKFALELQRRQLTCIGIHGPCIESYGKGNLNNLVNWCKRMRDNFKCNTIVVFRDPETFLDDDSTPDSEHRYYTDLSERASELNERLLEVDIKLVYHCFHIDLIPFSPRLVDEQQSQPVDEQQCGLKVLLDNITSNNFALQLDTYFLVTASNASKASSLSLTRIAEGRVSSVHVNDIYDNGRSAPMGSGTGDLSELVPQINKTNEHPLWILELDPTIGDSSERKDLIVESKEYWGQNAPSWLSVRR